MNKKRLAMAAAAAVSLIVLGVLLWRRPVVPSRVPMGSINGDVLFLDASSIVRRGSSRVVVVRLDGPAELTPHHYADEQLPAPQPIDSWGEHLDEVPILFNAGQFDETLAHLGWLKRDGRFIVDKRKEQWKGLLLSGPIDTGTWARIADLEQADVAVEQRYRHAVQSMMLIDDHGKLRVRDTDRAACRTIVAEDQRGRILIVVTEGAVTLADFGRWLGEQDLGVVRAMNMDGGIESQLLVRTPELLLTLYGQYGTGTTVFEGGPGTIRYPIPAVVAVRPKPRG